ncbi:MAG TPA: hypothetical protein VME69_10535 [Methylocella sp.]|nr:hypothetical protein [Methylocella sp.]
MTFSPHSIIFAIDANIERLAAAAEHYFGKVEIMPGDSSEEAPNRTYEKGVDRSKHVGTGLAPEIDFVKGSPRHFVGKCPHGIPDELKERLLNEAIADDNGDREIDFPKRLHVVHEGAIYRAETTTYGCSYHAFPYAGKLGKSLVIRLRKMADTKGCRKEFDNWVFKHIKLHGK